MGAILVEPTKEELESLPEQLEGTFGIKTPNRIYHVYKNRRGRYTGVKIWSYADLGTCRIEDLFLTNNDNELISIETVDLMTYLDDNEDELEGGVNQVTGEVHGF